MTNQEMLDKAKEKMLLIIQRYAADIAAEAAKALAFLVMAENGNYVSKEALKDEI